jgi:hypothetical protein
MDLHPYDTVCHNITRHDISKLITKENSLLHASSGTKLMQLDESM